MKTVNSYEASYLWTFGPYNISFRHQNTALQVYDSVNRTESCFDTIEAGAHTILEIIQALNHVTRINEIVTAIERTINLKPEIHGAEAMRALIRRILITLDTDTKVNIFKSVLRQILNCPSDSIGGDLFIELFNLMSEFLPPNQQALVCSKFPNLLLRIIMNHGEEERGRIEREPQVLNSILKMMRKWDPKFVLKMFLYNTKFIDGSLMDVLTYAVTVEHIKVPLLVQFIQSLPTKEQLTIYSNQSWRIRRPHQFIQKCDSFFSSHNLLIQTFYEAEIDWLLKELQDKVNELTSTESSSQDTAYVKLDETLKTLQSNFKRYQNSNKQEDNVVMLKDTWSKAIQGARKLVSKNYPPIWDILSKALLAMTIFGAVYLAYKAVNNHKQNRSLFFPSRIEQKFNVLENQVTHIRYLSDEERKDVSWDSLLDRTPSIKIE